MSFKWQVLRHVKVSKSQKQIHLFPFPQKNEQNSFSNSAQASRAESQNDSFLEEMKAREFASEIYWSYKRTFLEVVTPKLQKS